MSITLLFALLLLASSAQNARSQLDPGGQFDNPAVIPLLTQFVYSCLSNLTVAISQQLGNHSNFCIKDHQADWNKAFNFSANLDFLGTCLQKTRGWSINLIVYLIDEFNIKNIDAAQISNIVNGCISLFPVIGAIIADSFGCFSVIATSLCISFLGIFLLCLNTIFSNLRPPPCQIGSTLCEGAFGVQFTILYSALALGSLGIGGTRFITATMGANQLDSPKEQDIFFNWYFFNMSTASIVSAATIVYVQDTVSWAWGFGICLISNTVGLTIFLLGKWFCRTHKPEGSPFVGLVRVVVAAIRGGAQSKSHLVPTENLSRKMII